MSKRKIHITELVLRDGHQSQIATRMRTEDMTPISKTLDDCGFWSVESWGGATFDSCIRFLGEDPWSRIRHLKELMPKTKQQMLLRGQNLLGYRHYADDVVEKFIEQAIVSGVDIFRVFDALNDVRNIKTAIKAVIKRGAYAQATLSYTLSPVHNLEYWVDLAKKMADLNPSAIAIKDMAGLLTPKMSYDLVSRIKKEIGLPIHVHSHATTGLAPISLYKAVEAGADYIDTCISSFSMTYSHSSTEALVYALSEEDDYEIDVNLTVLKEVNKYFKVVRKKYQKFEGSLLGVDPGIIYSQVPGGMFSNLENQLKQQKAENRIDEVLEEIPIVRKDLGYIPLVTPSSQIVGTQAVLNVLSGRYKNLSKETKALLCGEYGTTPTPPNKELQDKVLKEESKELITCRFADLLPNEYDTLAKNYREKAAQMQIDIKENRFDQEVLIYAMFDQTGLYFLKNKWDKDKFEKKPEALKVFGLKGNYQVKLNDEIIHVKINESGDMSFVSSDSTAVSSSVSADNQINSGSSANEMLIKAPLSGTVMKIDVTIGEKLKKGDRIVTLEAMKIETYVNVEQDCQIKAIKVKEGDTVESDQDLLIII